MATTNCNIVLPAAADKIMAYDISRIVGQIVEALLPKNPYLNILPQATWEHGVSQTQRQVMQGEIAYADDLNFPTFVDATTVCGRPTLAREEMGKVEFLSRFGIKQIYGGSICLNDTVDAFAGSVATSINSLQRGIMRYKNNDIRGNGLYALAGTRATCLQNVPFSTTITGGTSEFSISAPLNSYAPNSKLTFKYLQKVSELLREDLKAGNNLFPGEFLRFIGSQAIVNSLRNEANVTQNGIYNALNFRAASGDKKAFDGQAGYTWEGPWSGIELGTDQRPLRFNVAGDGSLVFVQPDIAVVGATGDRYSIVNPAWQAAYGEVAFLVADDTLVYKTREVFNGENIAKFGSQQLGGEVVFNLPKGCDNPFQNYGELWAQLGRAYVPRFPGHIVAIYYARCDSQTNLTSCTTSSASA